MLSVTRRLPALICAALLSVSIAPAASARERPLRPFSYRVKVPAAETSCPAQAFAVASAFAVATGVSGARGACQGTQTVVDQGLAYPVNILLVNYLSEAELKPEVTVFGANSAYGKADPRAGVFPTYADCLRARSPQTLLFRQHTGLNPVASYCTPSNNQFFPGFSLSLESFGEGRARLYTYSEDRIGLPTDDHSRVVGAARLATEAAGGQVVWADASRFFYYAPGYVRISTANLGTFEAGAQCEAQAEQAGAIYSNAGLASVSAFCQDYHGYSTLMVVGAGFGQLFDHVMGEYSAYDECSVDLARVMANAASAGQRVLGGLCLPKRLGREGFASHVYVGVN